MNSDLDAELAALRQLGRTDLEQRWRTLFRAAPPAAYTPDLMQRGIAYRLQEQALGGLPRDLAQQLAPEGAHKVARRSLRPGNRLVRRWRGRTYVVEARDAGLSYNGASYGSLSEIARKITGTRWSGPRFFGLDQ